MLTAQVEGCMVSIMALRGHEQPELGVAIANEADAIRKRLDSDPKQTKARLEKARGKFAGLRAAKYTRSGNR